jgi:hypothetical protein
VETVGVPYDALLPKRGGGDAHFATLARSIVAQQISAAAARTITARLVDVAGGELTPGRVLGVEEQALRGAGLSVRGKEKTGGDKHTHTQRGRVTQPPSFSLSLFPYTGAQSILYQRPGRRVCDPRPGRHH